MKFRTRLNLSDGNFIQEANDRLSLSGKTTYYSPFTGNTLTLFQRSGSINTALEVKNNSNTRLFLVDYRNSGRLNFGINNTISGTTAIALGEGNISNGYASGAFGYATTASGDYGHSQNQYTLASGIGSHAGGRGVATRYIIASGNAAFNHSNNTVAQTSGHGALAPYSAILGGQNINIASGNTRAVVIGGNSIKLSGSTYIDTVMVPTLAIWDTPTAGASDDILTWNLANRKVTKITQASINATANNGLTKSGTNIRLGGNLTGHTSINTTGSTKMFELRGNGNIIIGNASALSNNTKLIVRGNTTTSGTTAIFQDSAGVSKLQLIDEGRIGFNTVASSGAYYKFRTLSTSDNDIASFINSGNTTLLSVGRVGGQLLWQTNTGIYSSTNDGTVTANGNGLIFVTNASFPNFTSNFYFVGTGGNNTVAGTRKLMRIGTGGSVWNPVSGTSEFTNILVDTSINAGSTYSGKVIGLDYAPNVTSVGAAQHIGVRLQSGALLVGTTNLASTITKFQLRGVGTTTGTTALFEDNSGTARFTLNDNGNTIFNIGSQIFSVRSGANNSIRLSQAGSIFFGTTTGALVASGNAGVQSISGTGLVYRADGGHSFNIGGNTPNVSLASFTGYSFTNGFRSGSGSNVGTGFYFNNILNTSGGTPTIVGIDYNQTGALGSATHIGLRVQKGGVLIGHTSLASNNTKFQVRGNGTTTENLMLLQDNAGTGRVQILDNGTGTINGNWNWASGNVFLGNNTTGGASKMLVTSTGFTSASYAAKFNNSSGQTIMNIRADQTIEIGGTSFIIEVDDTINNDNARFIVNNNQGSALVFEDKSGNKFIRLKSSTGDTSVVINSKVEEDYGLGFNKITRQNLVRSTTTAAGSNILASIPILPDTAIQLTIHNFMGYATDASIVALTGSQQAVIRNTAGLLSGATSTLTLTGNPATTALLRFVANSTADAAQIEFVNTTGTGKTWDLSIVYSYYIMDLPT